METKQSSLIGAIWEAVARGWGRRGQGGELSWECVGEAALPTAGMRTRWGELLPAYGGMTWPYHGHSLFLSSSLTPALGSPGHSESCEELGNPHEHNDRHHESPAD